MKKVKKSMYSLIAVIGVMIMNSVSVSIVSAQSGGPDSTVSIEFEAGDANIGPVNPEDPDIPGNGGGTGESGSLALNFVSHFFFEKQEILTTNAQYPTTTQTPYIQVTDARGTGEGWKVAARASKFTNEQGKGSLFGASITFTNASFNSPNLEVPAPQARDSVTLKFDGNDIQPIVSAPVDTGMGTWLTRWYTNPEDLLNHSVYLTVPSGGGMKGGNTATITWFLTSGPA